METTNRKKTIYRLNLALLMLNTAIIIFFLTSLKDKPQNEFAPISNELLKKELNFTDEQYQLINELDKDVLRKHQVILKLLCEKRYEIFNELAKPTPSIAELNRIAKSVGHLHQALKTQTSRHLLNLKKVCTPEQTQKLNELFIDFLEINTHCHECVNKCMRAEKMKRYDKFYPYNDIEADSLSMDERFEMRLK